MTRKIRFIFLGLLRNWGKGSSLDVSQSEALGLKATSFENSGTILAESGSIEIQAGTADISRGTNVATHGVYISAGNLFATNSTIIAGLLDLTVTNRISDFGPGANNVWEVTDGFSLLRKPFEGDLLGTQIRTIADGPNQVQHIWAGQDVGGGPDGFFNNVAIGHLILDIRSTNSSLRFTGANFQNALYVVNLEFNVGPDVDINANLNNLLVLDDNIRIFYINSNAGDKLTNAFPGKVIQVDNFIFDEDLAPLSVSANGFGIVTPNLDGKVLKIGDTYEVKARAGRGQMFKGWSGGANSQNASLKFTMRRHLALHANFVPNPFDDSSNPLQGTYNGLFSDQANGVKHESSGFFSLKLTKNGKFTGKILSGKSYPFRGAFDAFGHAQVPVRRARQSSLLLDLQLDMANHSDQITGTVSGNDWVSTLRADRANAGSVVDAGKYTMVIPGGEAPAPVGDSFGTIIVDAKGGLHFKGTLADGARVNQKVNLSKDGQWPFYSALYSGAGSIFSWITFTNGIESSIEGNVSWIKKPVPGRNYQSGFTNVSPVVGSTYFSTEPVLQITEGTVTLNGGNLDSTLTNNITFDSSTGATGVDGTRIQISLPSGLLDGSFVHPDTQKVTTLKGVILQQRNEARGFFFDAGQSGAFILESN